MATRDATSGEHSTMGSTQEDCSWVLDSIVGFLQGPIWNAPVITFIEHKSSIFEPGGTEHEQEYKNIFEEYKNLVDSMLTSYMDDIGISPEQFQKACDESTNGVLQIRFHQTLFEQVWAANDYEIFKRMMIQKNLELQLQALEMIQQRCGITPQSLLPAEGDSKLHTDEEVQVMEQVLRKSIEDYEASKEMLDTSTLEIEQSLATSSEERQRLEAECKREKELLHTALQHTVENSTPPVAESREEPEKIVTPQTFPEVHEEELERRKKYLKEQRDKLLALKKQERERQLAAGGGGGGGGSGGGGGGGQRPRSARAAQSALAGQPDANNAKNLQVRRALAERLKSEVVGHL